MVRELVVVKVPRSDAIPDKKASFAPLHNLHLDLMENKKKLKKNLPPVILKKPAPKPLAPPIQKKDPPAETVPKEIEIEIPLQDKKEAQISISKKEGKEKDKKESEEKDKKSKDNKDLEEKDDNENIIEEAPEPHQDEDEDVEEEKDDEEMLKEFGEDEEEKEEPEPPNTVEDAQEQEKTEDSLDSLSPEEKEEQEKQEYIWRFKILKKQYKNRNIPSYNEHDDLQQMKNEYKTIVKEIVLENNVESYKSYLIGGFMAMEFVFGNVFGINLSGFTSEQMLIMDKYEVMLIELGERPYSSWSSNLPIEIRLIMFTFWQAILFYVAKMLMDKGAPNVSSLFGGITGKPQQPKVEESQPVKKMRGPSIKVSDIKDNRDK